MNLIGKAKNPEIWSGLRDKDEYRVMLNALHKLYDETCIGEIETTKFSKFRLFKDCGDRTSYQQTFFKRQHRLYAISLMTLIYPENEEYLKLLQDTIWEVCDMYVWALPAHIGDIEHNDNCELDLDATSMGYALTLIRFMLEDRLHPLIISRIEAEIDRRLIKPFMAKHWHWEERRNNWTCVCAGSVGCVFMLLRPDLFPLVRDRINRCLNDYVDEYKDDGVCVEGAGYWSYGFGYFLEYALMQKQFTNGEFDLLKGEKIVNIATFLQKIFLDKNVIASFGDIPHNIYVSAGFMFTLKNLFPDKIQLPTFSRLEYNPHYFPFFIRSMTEYDPSFKEHDFSLSDEYYMDGCGWYTRRSKKYGLIAKGGTNGESHNHNDVGSFIISVDDSQLLYDIGSRPYTRQYFEDKYRYTYLETSSRGHNVPIINGEYQANVRGTRSYTKLENGVFSVDFKELYDIPTLKKLVREFKPDDDGVTIVDSFEGASSFTERLITLCKPALSDGVIDIGKAKIYFDKNLATADYETDTHALSLKENGDILTGETVYLINIKVKEPKDSFEFRIEIK